MLSPVQFYGRFMVCFKGKNHSFFFFLFFSFLFFFFYSNPEIFLFVLLFSLINHVLI